MNDVQQKVLDFFTNEKLLRAVRIVVITLIIILLPLFYFGFKTTFDIRLLWNLDFGAIVVIVTLSVVLATIETKIASYDLTCDTDVDLPTLHIKIKENSKKIRNNDKNGKISTKWISNYNKDQQKMYNEIKTNELIDVYEEKALLYRVKGKEKKAEYYDRQIKKLRKTKIKDKTFVPYSIKRILNIEKGGFKFNRKKGNTDINTDPKKVNWKLTLISMILRSSGVGALGTIPFVMSESVGTVLGFYVGYILIISFTVLSQWIMTSYVTTHSYKSGLETIIDIQELLLQDLNIESQVNSLPFADIEKDSN